MCWFLNELVTYRVDSCQRVQLIIFSHLSARKSISLSVPSAFFHISNTFLFHTFSTFLSNNSYISQKISQAEIYCYKFINSSFTRCIETWFCFMELLAYKSSKFCRESRVLSSELYFLLPKELKWEQFVKKVQLFLFWITVESYSEKIWRSLVSQTLCSKIAQSEIDNLMVSESCQRREKYAENSRKANNYK